MSFMRKFLIPDPPSYSGTEKATKLLLQVMRKVKLEPSNYYKIINYLRQDKRKYGDTVDILDSEYFGIRDFPESKLPQGSYMF